MRSEVKGYYVPYGYMGYVGDHYILFATVEEYIDYIYDYNFNQKEDQKDGKGITV